MLRQLYLQKNILMFHARVCHRLVNDAGRKEVREKRANYNIVGGNKNAILRVMCFLNDSYVTKRIQNLVNHLRWSVL